MRGAGRGSKREGGFCYGAAAAATAEMRAAGLAGGRWLAEMRGGGKLHLRLQHWQAKRQENQEEKGERQHSGTWGPHGVGPSLNSLLVAVVTLGPYGHTGFGLERAMWGIRLFPAVLRCGYAKTQYGPPPALSKNESSSSSMRLLVRIPKAVCKDAMRREKP